MNTFNIDRWDSMLVDKNQHPIPVIYIKLSDKLSKLSTEFNNELTVVINNTNSIYDGKPMIGTINSSSHYPNYRPNFFNKNQYITISLGSQWHGYPPNNGNITINKLTKSIEYPTARLPLFTEYYNNKNGLTKTEIYLLLFILGILLIFIYFTYNYHS